ncbi:MAG: glycogen debranching enzyme family protein [Lachnospiraceae bacterium]|nr:glycogen debranching enzyme family protein [Lachnospiraceae bacterium]
MRFVYGKQDFSTFERGEENCWLMTNGLGGFSSLTMLGSCSRNDHAVLMSCKKEEAPNHRYNMIHGLEEVLRIGADRVFLSSQDYVEEGRRQEGYCYLSCFTYEDYPRWEYLVSGVEITKKILLQPECNTVGISYQLRNHSGQTVSLEVTPLLQFVPKGQLLSREESFSLEQEPETKRNCNRGMICSNDKKLYYKVNGSFREQDVCFRENLYYAYDACDGRREIGCCAVNHRVCFTVEARESFTGELVYSADDPVEINVAQIEDILVQKRQKLVEQAGLKDETARTLVKAADQFIAYRASTGKQTILAGFPFFEDWGRDTMIALTGCCLSTGQLERAKEILRTFMQYTHKGLMPNLFPEGAKKPLYNTVDASLLFILAVYHYYRKTRDVSFVAETYPVMEEIVTWYRKGTDYSICMDVDGLIRAGRELDQVTWMDVRVGDILPTPRHGKPVEINAYWYNALRILEELGRVPGVKDRGNNKVETADYGALAKQVRKSFCEQFWDQKKQCLRDVVSGGPADEQIRCNQIWAVAQPFSLLEAEQEKAVVETVFCLLYTPVGLRTLDPADNQFHPVYGGELLERDLAYHQGTVWTYPLGAYYLAYLKVNGYSREAVRWVQEQLEAVTAALREGCIGQLPEIYDGLEPKFSKGCFAQAWSVGELLRVYEALEQRCEYENKKL